MAEQFDTPCWFVLRDLKRSNAKAPAYKALPELGFETFTPMHWVIKDNSQGGKRRNYVPFIPSLLFVKALKVNLDPVISKTETLQYRFVKGAQATPMTVPEHDMDRFINAVSNDTAPIFFSPDELTPDMLGRDIIVTGGLLDGYRGKLLKVQGSKKRRLIVKIEDFVAAAVEVNPNYIQFV